MFKFIYARHKIHPRVERYHEQWYLLLDTFERVLDYTEHRSSKVVGAYFRLKKKWEKGNARTGHLSDRDEQVIEVAMLCTENKRKTIMDDLKILDEHIGVYFKCFMDGMTMAVSPNGAFRPVDETFDILAEVESEVLVFPVTSESDIKVTQWEGGLHFYATVGNMTVYDDKGNMKWNTEEEAKRWAMRALAVGKKAYEGVKV
jgi:hypothetical protein